MRSHIHLFSRNIIVLLLLATSLSCDKFFEVDVDSSQILEANVFSSDANATSAMAGLYQSMVSSGLFGGGSTGLSALTGLASDELYNFADDPLYLPFQQNNLAPDNALVGNLWNEGYFILYQSNNMIINLDQDREISAGVKQQLLGEAYFIRALCHFYLSNIFGDIPIITTNDYRINSVRPRANYSEVLSQVVHDLSKSQSLLTIEYPETERVRPNKIAATALLARVYLYMGLWEDAIRESTTVIDNTGYQLEDPYSTFLKESKETIFQLAFEANRNTKDASTFLIVGSPSSNTQCISAPLLSAFEASDLRRSVWVSEYEGENTGDIIFYPSKYKAPTIGPSVEYYILLRLAEQYLIRAESYAKTSHNDDAVYDINVIRARAGIEALDPATPELSQELLLSYIRDERQKELFSEWGHRWFDLKRTGEATAVLSGQKENWDVTDILFPVPQIEFQRNPFLGRQNDGY